MWSHRRSYLQAQALVSLESTCQQCSPWKTKRRLMRAIDINPVSTADLSVSTNCYAPQLKRPRGRPKESNKEGVTAWRSVWDNNTLPASSRMYLTAHHSAAVSATKQDTAILPAVNVLHFLLSRLEFVIASEYYKSQTVLCES